MAKWYINCYRLVKTPGYRQFQYPDALQDGEGSSNANEPPPLNIKKRKVSLSVRKKNPIRIIIISFKLFFSSKLKFYYCI